MHSGLLHILVHIPLHVLGPLLSLFQLSPCYGGSIDDVTNRVSPCFLNNRGDREAPHTFEYAVVHLRHIGHHSFVPRVVCAIE